jgi:oxalate decarboxylase
MTIMNPDGTLDTWNMTTGDMYFIPRAYPHHIDTIGHDDWHFLVFFDQPFLGGHRLPCVGQCLLA